MNANELSVRLARLERTNRRLKGLGGVLLLGLVAVVVMGQAGPADQARDLTVRSVRVVDDSGIPVAYLGANDAGGLLRLSDDSGLPRILADIDAEEGASVSMFDKRGRLVFNVGESGEPYVEEENGEPPVPVEPPPPVTPETPAVTPETPAVPTAPTAGGDDYPKLTAGTTPEETFTLLQGAMEDQNWGGMFDLLAPTAYSDVQELLDEIQSDESAAAMFGAQLGLSPEQLQDIELRDFFIAVLKAMAGQAEDELQALVNAEIVSVEVEPVEEEGEVTAYANLRYRMGSGEEATEETQKLAKIDGRWYLAELK